MRKEEFYRDAIPGSLGPLKEVRVLEASTSQTGPMAGTVMAALSVGPQAFILLFIIELLNIDLPIVIEDNAAVGVASCFC